MKPAEEGESDLARVAEKLEGDRKKLREAVMSDKLGATKKQLSSWSYDLG